MVGNFGFLELLGAYFSPKLGRASSYLFIKSEKNSKLR
jgi:hypothetical protein